MSDRLSHEVKFLGDVELHVWVNGGKAGTLRLDPLRATPDALERFLAVFPDWTPIHAPRQPHREQIHGNAQRLGGHVHFDFKINELDIGRLIFRVEEIDAITAFGRVCDTCEGLTAALTPESKAE